MAERSVVVGSKVGLHARPAAEFTHAAGAAGIPVTIAVGAGDPVDAASMLAVMTLGVEYGTEVTLRAEGDGADRLLDGLVDLLASDLDAA
ncbi:HPr family phosphocarrier protein [Nocardia sp. NPDC059180]|uniref:HPr family phosphocarrier protein n=1 Tax=Nocardia sp. NPDC059180 TaxID=3346761 RepID=UPI0036B59A6C